MIDKLEQIDDMPRLTSAEQLNDDGCLALAGAILEGAARDYLSARRALKRAPKDERARESYEVRRRFFLSDYFHWLSMGMDGEAILESLDRYEEGGERRGRAKGAARG